MLPRPTPLIKATAKLSHISWLHLVAMFCLSWWAWNSLCNPAVMWLLTLLQREQSLAQMDLSVDPQIVIFLLIFSLICFLFVLSPPLDHLMKLLKRQPDE